MKCCRHVLVGALAVAGLLCGCGDSKVKSTEKVAARQSAKGASNAAAAHVTKPAPDPAWVSEIRLKGIGGTTGRRLAIINGKTLGPGDGIQVKIAGKVVILHCIAVRETSVMVRIEGIEGERELRLN